MIVYALYINEDSMEGRGPMTLRGLYETEDLAWGVADDLEPRGDSRYWRDMPRNGTVSVKPMEVISQSHRERQAYLKMLRAKTLSSLTKDQREALELK
jgi:hypothetical protein